VDHASWRSFEDPGTIDLAPAAVPAAFRYAQSRRHGEKTLPDGLIVLGSYKVRRTRRRTNTRKALFGTNTLLFFLRAFVASWFHLFWLKIQP
jgi:hypothetical protein